VVHAWVVIVPVKSLARAKTRLRGTRSQPDHERLVLAMAVDTVTAALASQPVRAVVVVTEDPTAGSALSARGARVVPDAQPAADRLNRAITHAAADAAQPGAGLAVLPADLPALRPTDLAAALEQAGQGLPRRYLPDAAGTGTVLLTAAPGVALAPRFGPASAAAHAAGGAVRLDGDWPSLRRDVDTAEDLALASALGLGAHTAAATGWGTPGWDDGSVQATVARYDGTTRTGQLLLDDGTRLDFGAAAFDASGLRLVRIGQRVRVARDGSGAVVRIGLPVG
jgi:2-phospho-L-lactate/phosphoenolpyruvate guanylyltransferase